MKISIVMPVYNVEKYICECVDSVLRQTLSDFELIVVDDGSSDSSGKILDKYKESDSRVTVIHKKNEGVSIARNTALRRCTGDYIYIMDSDDYLEQNALETMYNEAIRTEADVIITDHIKFFPSGEKNEFHYFPNEFVTEEREIIRQLQKMILHRSYSPYPTKSNRGTGIGTPWSKLIKRELIVGNNLEFDPYVRGLFDDCLFSMRVFEVAKKVCYYPAITYHFRILSSSLTHRFRPNQLEVYSRIFEKIREFGKEYDKGEDFYKAYYARVITYLSLSFDSYFFNKGYKGGKRKNRKEFKNTIMSKDYLDAIHNVEVNILEKREKRLVWFTRCRMVDLLWLVYSLKEQVDHFSLYKCTLRKC